MVNVFAKLSEQLSQLVGDKMTFGMRKNLEPSVNQYYPDMLWHEFPYEAYDPQLEIFYNKRSQGFVLEVLPLTGANKEVEKLILSLIVDVLPKNAYMQCLLWGSNQVGHILDHFETSRGQSNETYAWLAKKRAEYFKQGIYHSLLNSDDFLVRDLRLFITVSLPIKGQDNKESDLVNVRKHIITSLKSINTIAASLPIDEFINVISSLLNPSSSIYSTKHHWNRHESLSMQLINSESLLDVQKDHLTMSNKHESWEIRSLTVADIPKTMTQWNMTHAIGHLFNSALQMPCPFLISFTLKLIDGDKSKAQWSSYDAGKKANSKMTEWFSTLSSEYADWSYVRQRLDQGDKLASTCFHVTLYSPNGRGLEHEAKTRDLYRANGWRLSNPFCMQLPYFKALFPMLLAEGLYDDLKLLGFIRTMLASNAVNIAPLQGEWRGTRSAALLLPGRRGQLAMWSPFDNQEGNFNVSVAASSGKGKSMVIQDYIIGLLGSGGRVWVIDVGRSYERTCYFVNGVFIEFSREKSICINPFSFIKDFDASLSLLKPLLSAMARPTTNTTDEENAYLEKALKAAWHREGTNSTITTVATWLREQESTVCQNLSHLLYSFTKDGMYGRYFEGQSDIDIDQDFVVLELQELKSKPDLQRIVLLTLMYQISEAMYSGNRKQHKSCIIDEAWDLLNGEQDGTAKFIEVGYRTARKFNGNFVTIVQSINDYFKSAASIAAFENSDYRLILGQTEEAIDQLKRSERLAIDPYTEHVLKSLRKTDEYSECVIKSPSALTIHRIIFDPYSRILYSSKGDEFEAVKQLEASGLSLRDAIDQVAGKLNHAG